MLDDKDSTFQTAKSSSAERSLRLLACLASEGRAMSLADLAVRLSLPKVTAHRLCMQLLEAGFVTRDVNERDYTVGPALRKLAFDTLNHGAVRGLRHQILTELVEQVGETCNITTLDGASVLYLDRVEALRPWRLTLSVGEHVPLHCTASGKLYLALLPGPQRELLVSQITLTAMTESTITTAEALVQECAKVRTAGYALDQQEFIDGLLAIAVPIFDEHGAIRATVAVHAPISRFSVEQARSRLPALHQAAERLGKLL